MARALEHDLALLPAIWASESDFIIAPPDVTLAPWMLRKRVRIYRGETAVNGASPWGWSLNARQRLIRAGVPASMLPSDTELQRLRYLSHRRTALALSRALVLDGIQSPNHPLEISDPSQLTGLMAEGHPLLLKRPWSCSGRGVFPLSHLSAPQAIALAEGIIRKQGSVMVERQLTRRADFSAILHSDGNEVKLRGWTLFHTSPEGRYEGSIVAPQSLVTARLAALGCDTAPLEAALVRRLPSIISGYRGWLSVDMLATADGSIAPAIEVNLRRTMGVVALDIADSLPASEVPLLLAVKAADALPAPSERVITGGSHFKMTLSEVQN